MKTIDLLKEKDLDAKEFLLLFSKEYFGIEDVVEKKDDPTYLGTMQQNVVELQKLTQMSETEKEEYGQEEKNKFFVKLSITMQKESALIKKCQNLHDYLWKAYIMIGSFKEVDEKEQLSSKLYNELHRNGTFKICEFESYTNYLNTTDSIQFYNGRVDTLKEAITKSLEEYNTHHQEIVNYNKKIAFIKENYKFYTTRFCTNITYKSFLILVSILEFNISHLLTMHLIKD